jgi:hypothetical protein
MLIQKRIRSLDDKLQKRIDIKGIINTIASN